MSAIRAMDAASPNHAPPVSASKGSGVAESGHPFAEAMRSAVAPPQRAQKASGPSGASGASRPQFHRSNITAAKNSKRAQEPASAPSSDAPNAKSATSASNQDSQNADPSGGVASSSAASDGISLSLVDGQAQVSVAVTAVEDRSSGVTPQRVSTPPAQTGTSPSETRWKQTSPAKDANGDVGASGSSSVAAAASLTVASISAMVPNIPILKLPAAVPTGPSVATASASGTKPIDAHTGAKDTSLSSPAGSGPAVRIAQPGESAAATGIVPNGGAISDGIVSSQPTATVHGVLMIDEKRGATSNPATAVNTDAPSAPNHNEGPDGSSGTQPASFAGGTSAHALANAISNSSADANASNAVSATGAVNSGVAGNDAVKGGGDRASTSIHGSDGSKSSSFTAAIPTVATSEKDLPGPHTNLADSSLGLHGSAGLVSAAGHPGASGSSTPTAAGSTAARATTSDAFTALDSAAAGERGVLLHAAPHQVAVGLSDPSLGWVEVRAERVSGQIAAALTTNSAASHAALISVLPTMATYLQEHQAGVHQVHVETSLAGGQAGTGSQGQASSQNQARTAPDNLTVANAATNSWNAGPVGSATVTAAQRNNLLHEGHFSIRA